MRFPSLFFLLLALLSSLRSAFGGLPEKTVLVHYMPWYASKAVSGSWGWHWTMGHFDPDRILWDDKREVASHDYPLIGPYDSGDDDALECQVLLMKFAGLDGVIIDWYGTIDHLDYPQNHRNTQKIIPWLKRAGLRFAVCYEDQALQQWAKAAKRSDAQIQAQARLDLEWAQKNWFTDSSYVQVENRPLLLIFGPQTLTEAQLRHAQGSLDPKPLVYGLPHLAKAKGTDGAFGWPPVEGGKTVPATQWQKQLSAFHARAGSGERLVATAFPGFHDIYAQAGVHPSYGGISTRSGATFNESLDSAEQSSAPIVQIATWNDYGEGTMIEPTRAHGFRYLEALRKRLPKKALGSADLRLPVTLYQLRKRAGHSSQLKEQLNAASNFLFKGECMAAEALLAKVTAELSRQPAAFPETPETSDPEYRLVTDVLYRERGAVEGAMHQRCRLDFYFPVNKKDFPTVIWFHGGGLSVGGRSIPLALRRRGLGVIAANYRLTPENPSPSFLEDAAAAVAWTFKHLSDYGGDPKKIFVSGHSAGAYLSLMLGLDKRWLAPYGIDPMSIAGLIPLSPQTITHFAIREERGIDEKQAVVDDLAPLFHVTKNAPPCLLVTGDREKELLGRYEETAYFWRMMKLSGHKDVSLLELQGFDHGMAEPALPLLLRFVRNHLPKTQEKSDH
jgi:acetyl esterase/lipase